MATSQKETRQEAVGVRCSLCPNPLPRRFVRFRIPIWGSIALCPDCVEAIKGSCLYLKDLASGQQKAQARRSV